MGEPGAFELEDDGGRAKSVDDVGRDGLIDASGIPPTERRENSETKSKYKEDGIRWGLCFKLLSWTSLRTID